MKGHALICCVACASCTQMTFEQAAEKVKTLKDKPSNDVLLQIYVRTRTHQTHQLYILLSMFLIWCLAPPHVDFVSVLQGLYKQATVGDNTTSQPWAVQMTERAKWDAWTSFKGQFARGRL